MLYADTSALVKLVLAEAESAALRQHIAGQELVCSALAITELERAVTRAGPGYGAQVQDVLDGIYLVSLDDEHLRRAGRLGPQSCGRWMRFTLRRPSAWELVWRHW